MDPVLWRCATCGHEYESPIAVRTVFHNCRGANGLDRPRRRTMKAVEVKDGR